MRFFRAVTIGVASLLWTVSASAAPPPPSGGDPAAAREQLKIGYTLAQEGKCAEALPHLTESLRLDARAITLLNLADCEEKTGKLGDAAKHWVEAKARGQAEGVKAIEEEATNRSAALDARIPRLTIVLAKTAPPGATVERDGAPVDAATLGTAVPLDPGPHTVVIKAAGRADAQKKIVLAEGEKQTLEVDAGAAPVAPPTTAPPVTEKPSSGMSPLVPIGFGVGIVGLAVGSITGIMTLGKGSDAETECPNKRCINDAARDNVDSGKTLGTVSTIAFIAGGVGAAVGVVGLLIGGGKTTESKEAKRSRLDVGIGPTSLMLRGSF